MDTKKLLFKITLTNQRKIKFFQGGKRAGKTRGQENGQCSDPIYILSMMVVVLLKW